LEEESLVQKRFWRKRQPSKHNPNATVKGATVNRELGSLKCIFHQAVRRKYISESPAAGVKPSMSFGTGTQSG